MRGAKAIAGRKMQEMKKPDETFPLFCDYACPHAAFPPADAVGACRREQGVFCTLLTRFNNKNGPCLARKER